MYKNSNAISIVGKFMDMNYIIIMFLFYSSAGFWILAILSVWYKSE